MSSRKALIWIVILGGLALLAGCFSRSATGPVSPTAEPIHMTVVAMPEGFSLKPGDDVEKLLSTDKVRSIFSYYTNDKGLDLQAHDLGLSVVGFRGTLEPTDSSIDVLVSSTTDASGNLSIKPIVELSGNFQKESVLKVTIKGNLLKIAPAYHLEIDPTNKVMPRGYVQEIYYADQVAVSETTSTTQSASAKATYKKIGGSLSANHETNTAIERALSHSLFGKMGVELGNPKLLSDSLTIPWSAGAAGKIAYGNDPSERQKRQILVTNADLDGRNVTCEFNGSTYKIHDGSYALLDEKKWNALRASIDLQRRLVTFESIAVPADTITGIAPIVRFKDPLFGSTKEQTALNTDLAPRITSLYAAHFSAKNWGEHRKDIIDTGNEILDELNNLDEGKLQTENFRAFYKIERALVSVMLCYGYSFDPFRDPARCERIADAGIKDCEDAIAILKKLTSQTDIAWKNHEHYPAKLPYYAALLNAYKGIAMGHTADYQPKVTQWMQQVDKTYLNVDFRPAGAFPELETYVEFRRSDTNGARTDAERPGSPVQAGYRSSNVNVAAFGPEKPAIDDNHGPGGGS